MTLITGACKTIIIHPGTYTESPSITIQYTVLTGPGLLGGNILIDGTLSTNTGCTISGLKMTNLTINTPTATGNVNILNCEISSTFTKTSNADYTLIRFCDIGTTNITGGGLVAIFGGNPNLITINNALARVIVKNSTCVSPSLTAGNANFVDSIVIATGATTNALTTSAGTIVTLANSQFIIPTFNNVARVSLSGFYSIFNTVYDKPNSTLISLSGTGGPTDSIDYFQFINANKFITQGGASTQYVKGDGSLDSTGTTNLGNVLRVDSINGNNSTASIGGNPYLTIQGAIAAIGVGTGYTIWVLPGTYNLSAGITLPDGNSIRGLSTQTTIIQMLSVTANTTLVTMGENTRMEDLTLKLTSSGHYTLKGILFGGSSSITAKIRTCVLTVDNSTASVGGSSIVTGVEALGTGTLGTGTFSFNSLKGATFNVYSNGGGNKRGILVSGTNLMSTRDVNIYVAQPSNTASTGSYVGVETADSSNTGSIQLRTTTIGTVTPVSGNAYTASDILQTNPTTITNPSYLASAGIQVGPGTDLVTKTAGGKGFSTYSYPTTVFYGLKGNVRNIINGYLWPGTQEVKNNIFPDSSLPAAYYRIQQPCILSGISCGLNTAPGTGNAITLTVRRTPIATGTIVDTIFTVTFGATDILQNFYNGSVNLAAGDRIHIYLTGATGTTAATDLTVQIDMF